ncbi:MAG: hypothetical protein Q8S13_05345, partial [Dehalococcoidia bacterium]|nr:hypothetical protein [Dehalococcoidia bacterium]
MAGMTPTEARALADDGEDLLAGDDCAGLLEDIASHMEDCHVGLRALADAVDANDAGWADAETRAAMAESELDAARADNAELGGALAMTQDAVTAAVA